jgi:hypothetical protein
VWDTTICLLLQLCCYCVITCSAWIWQSPAGKIEHRDSNLFSASADDDAISVLALTLFVCFCCHGSTLIDFMVRRFDILAFSAEYIFNLLTIISSKKKDT